MKIIIINKSDSTGGAAIVSRRLMEALRNEGADARMLVVEKLSDSPYVELAASRRAIRKPFLAERLKIFVANGLNRSTLFKIDTASDGLPLWKHPLVVDADAIILNWVNQGMLSLKGVRKLLELRKPVLWTMHDMWNMTGICHHAGECTGYLNECGNCHLLGKRASRNDLSYVIWQAKHKLGELSEKLHYVAVSNWLASKAAVSSLLGHQDMTVIPNAFPIEDNTGKKERRATDRISILFGAARLDDPVKNLPAMLEMTRVLQRDYPDLAARMRLVTFGNIKNPSALEKTGLVHHHLGMVKGEEAVRKVYEEGDILVSSSSYETLPGTLVEAQAYGCIPVSFNQGGQKDIVDHLDTGYIAAYDSDPCEAGRRLAEGVAWAAGIISDPAAHSSIIDRMRSNVISRFSASAVAQRYLALLASLGCR